MIPSTAGDCRATGLEGSLGLFLWLGFLGPCFLISAGGGTEGERGRDVCVCVCVYVCVCAAASPPLSRFCLRWSPVSPACCTSLHPQNTATGAAGPGSLWCLGCCTSFQQQGSVIKEQWITSFVSIHVKDQSMFRATWFFENINVYLNLVPWYWLNTCLEYSYFIVLSAVKLARYTFIMKQLRSILTVWPMEDSPILTQ